MSSYLTGLRWSDWRRLLHEHTPAVDRGYRLRAARISVGTALTSLLARCEPEVQWSDELERLWTQPLIILGLPRSGTTFLHQLLACNPRLASPTRLDCFHPWTCLTLHRWGVAALLGRLPRRARGMDQVQIGWSSPEEDEFALAALTAAGPWIAHAFRRSHAERGQPPTVDYSEDETQAWQNALRLFTRKLIWLTRRPLVLKSPLHTGRIPGLRALFPAARFITIFRDPREQLRSVIDVPQGVRNWGVVQDPSPLESGRPEKMANVQNILLRRYFDTRGLIPPSRLRELTYEDLVADPLAILQSLHEGLALPGWNEAHCRLAAGGWWQGYRRNQTRPLTPSERELALTAYQPLFAAGHYPEALQELKS